MRLASDRTVFNDLGTVERNLRFIHLLRRHAFRVFEQCRKEIQPLYQSLARFEATLRRALRSRWSACAETAFRIGAPSRLWPSIHYVSNMRSLTPPSNQSWSASYFSRLRCRRLSTSTRRTKSLLGCITAAGSDSLPELAAASIPMDDLLGWAASSETPIIRPAEVLAGFSTLFFHVSDSAVTSRVMMPTPTKLPNTFFACTRFAWKLR